MELEQAQKYRENLKAELAGSNLGTCRWYLRELKQSDPLYEISKYTLTANRRAQKGVVQIRENSQLQFRVEEATASEESTANPLLEISSPEESLTEEQRIVLWTTRKQAAFESFPKDGNSASRKRAQRIVEETAQALITDPKKMGTAGRTWKSRIAAGSEEQAQNSFYERVKKEVTTKLQRQKELLPQNTLKELIRSYAYGKEVMDLPQATLAVYFNRKISRQANIDALYDFAFVILDLVEDPAAFETAVRIANFRDLEVLSLGSKTFLDFKIARSTIDNDQLLSKAWIYDSVTFDLLQLTTIDGDEIKKENAAFTQNDPAIYNAMLRESERLVEKFAKGKSETDWNRANEEVQRRSRLLRQAQDTKKDVFSMEEIQKLQDVWPSSILFNPSDPLRMKFREVAGNQIASLKMQEKVMDILTKSGVSETTFVSIPFVENPTSPPLMVDILIGGKLDQRKRTLVLQEALNHIRAAAPDQRQIAERHKTMTAVAFYGPHFLGHTTYDFWFRLPSTRERKLHPLIALEALGFPYPQLEEGDNFQEALQSIHQEVLHGHLRFLNKRGVQVRVIPQSFRDLGYQAVTFKTGSTDQQQSVSISIRANELEYPVHLDRHFNLNFEGQTPPSAAFTEPLHYTLLHLLEPILCEVKKRDQPGIDAEGNLEVLSRIGHFRELTRGQHYSQAAILNCFSERGVDLTAEQARLQLVKTTSNMFTYVKEVWEPDSEDLLPLEFHVPSIKGYH